MAKLAEYSFDNQNTGTTYRVTLTDRLGLHDSNVITGERTQHVTITDDLGLRDRITLGGDFAGQIRQVNITDSLGIFDTVANQEVIAHQTATDRLGLHDSVTVQTELGPRTLEVLINDLLGMSDSVTPNRILPVGVTEIYGEELDISRNGAVGVAITARLVSALDQVWDDAESNIIRYATTTTDMYGHWSLRLTPTENYTAQTYYDVSVGLHRIYPIDVPISDTPVNIQHCLIDRPPPPDDSGGGTDQIIISSTEPLGPHYNQLWFDTSTEE